MVNELSSTRDQQETIGRESTRKRPQSHEDREAQKLVKHIENKSAFQEAARKAGTHPSCKFVAAHQVQNPAKVNLRFQRGGKAKFDELQLRSTVGVGPMEIRHPALRAKSLPTPNPVFASADRTNYRETHI
jgi:hypothetical protein